MSKVDPPSVGTYAPTSYVTGDQIVQHYGVASVSVLPTPEQTRYNNYASLSNKQTETVIYKYIDTIPLAATDEARTYAVVMALYYAIWLKQVDDGANNVPAMKEMWETFKAQLIQVLQSQPKNVNTRRIVSNGYTDDGPPPYSQSYGLSDIL